MKASSRRNKGDIDKKTYFKMTMIGRAFVVLYSLISSTTSSGKNISYFILVRNVRHHHSCPRLFPTWFYYKYDTLWSIWWMEILSLWHCNFPPDASFMVNYQILLSSSYACQVDRNIHQICRNSILIVQLAYLTQRFSQSGHQEFWISNKPRASGKVPSL